MWFKKQARAFAHDDQHPGIVVAEDISRHGHKRYGVFPLSHVDCFQGAHNEVIRTSSVCRLYFDCDGGPDTSLGDFIDCVCDFVNQIYDISVVC